MSAIAMLVIRKIRPDRRSTEELLLYSFKKIPLREVPSIKILWLSRLASLNTLVLSEVEKEAIWLRSLILNLYIVKRKEIKARQ